MICIVIAWPAVASDFGGGGKDEDVTAIPGYDITFLVLVVLVVTVIFVKKKEHFLKNWIKQKQINKNQANNLHL